MKKLIIFAVLAIVVSLAKPGAVAYGQIGEQQLYYTYGLPDVSFANGLILAGGYIQTMGWGAPNGGYWLSDNTDVVSAWEFNIGVPLPVVSAAAPDFTVYSPYSYYSFYSTDPNTSTSFTDENILAGPQSLTLYPGAKIIMLDPALGGWSLTLTNDQFTVTLNSPSGPVSEELPQVDGNGNLGSVPEPTTFVIWSLIGASAIGVGWWRRKAA
jgi:hypothetical protein